MTSINIKPFKQCGPISFNNSYQEIKNNAGHTEFKKSPFSKFVTSSIMGGNLHVFYDKDGICSGVEVFPPLEVVWNDLYFFKNSLKDCLKLLEDQKIKTELSDSGLELPGLGISIYSHEFDESLECSVDSVYVSFERT